VRISAYSLSGDEVQIEATGLLARCVQHELDHLDGVLFPDRMSSAAKADIQEDLDVFETEFKSRQQTGGAPGEEQIARQWAEWESKYA
jgi:peptide deformylase